MPRRSTCLKTCCNHRQRWLKPITNINRRYFHSGQPKPILRKRLGLTSKGLKLWRCKMPADPSTSNVTPPPATPPAEEAGTPAPAKPAAPQVSEAKSRSWWSKLIPIVVFLMAAAILFAITGNWNSWIASRETQETDNAYLRADLTPLSTRV